MKTDYRKTTKLLFAWFLMACACSAHAASFDCAKAESNIEKMICGDAGTSALDSKLQQTYKTALAATDAYGRKALAKEQRNWITYTRGICQDTECLRQVYVDRITVLARNEKYIEDYEPDCVSPIPAGDKGDSRDCGTAMQMYRDPNSHIALFNQSLTQPKLSGKIIGCSRLISMWPGTHIGPGRGVEVFGGYCVLQDGTERKNIEICTDEDTSPLDANNEDGYINIRPTSPKTMSAKNLIDFTYECE